MFSVINNLKNSLEKTRSNVTLKIKSIFNSHTGISEELLEELEEILVLADIGVETTTNLIDALRDHFTNETDVTYEDVLKLLKKQVYEDLSGLYVKSNTSVENIPQYVILVIGVNGTGKTTSIGKLAQYYKNQGKRVMLAASDTFRAAAVEQLEIWKNRVGVDLIKNKKGTDPAAVAFDAAHAALARGTDILIIDTAGRIHTNSNLIQELVKIKRVTGKVIPGAPHKTLLVIDANMGQNSISQARIFTEAINVNGIILTKLDGTAKGGAAIPIMKNLLIPIEFIGTGEQKEDFRKFDIIEFTEALFS